MKVLLALSVLMVYGPYRASRFVLPVYQLARITSLGEFYERLDVIPLLGWSLSMVIQLCVMEYATVNALKRLFGVRDYRPLTFPTSLVKLCLALISFDDVNQFRALMAPDVTGVYHLVFICPLVPLLLLVSAIRRTPARTAAQEDEE